MRADFLHEDAGHQNVIDSLAFSPDGSQILSGSWDGTAKLWDAATGRLLRTFGWNCNQVTSVAWSPDGKFLAIAGEPPPATFTESELEQYQAYFDGRNPSYFDSSNEQDDSRTAQVRLFTADDGTLLRGIDNYGGGVAFSPDGRHLAVLGWDTLAILDLRDGHCLVSRDLGRADNGSLNYSCDGKLILCFNSNGAQIFDADSAELMRVAEDSDLFGNGFSKDTMIHAGDHSLTDQEGYAAINAVLSRIITFWQQNIPEFRPPSAFQQMLGLQLIAFSPDEGCAAFTFQAWSHPASGFHVAIVQTATCEVVRFLAPPVKHWLRATGFSPDGKLLAVAGDDQQITIRDVATGVETARTAEPPPPIAHLAISPVASYVVAGTRYGTVHLCELDCSRILSKREMWDEPIAHIEFSPLGEIVLIASRHGKIRICAIPGLETLVEFPQRHARFLGGTFSPDGMRFVSVGYDDVPAHNNPRTMARVVDWSIDAVCQLSEQALPDGFAVTCVAASSDRQKLAISSPDEIHVVDLTNENNLRPVLRRPVPKRKGQGIGTIAFAGDQSRVLFANEWYRMEIADLVSKAIVVSFSSTRDAPRSFAFTADGKWMARSNGYMHEIEFFEVATGKLKKYFIGHQHSVAALAFTPDNRFLISGGMDGTLKRWNVENGELLGSMLLPTDERV